MLSAIGIQTVQLSTAQRNVTFELPPTVLWGIYIKFHFLLLYCGDLELASVTIDECTIESVLCVHV